MDALLEQDNSQATATTEATGNVTTDSGINTGATAQPTGTWLDTLPESFRQEGSISRHGSMDELLNSYTHAQKMIGGKNYVPDFENDSPEIIGRFKEQMGVPKTADEYKFELPEGFQPDESFNLFKELAYKGNVPNDIANQFMGMHQQAIQGAAEQFKANQEAEINSAFEEFASDPNFSDISNNTRNLIQQIDPSGEFLSEETLGKLGVEAPNVARFLNKAAQMISDDSVPKGKNAGSGFGSYEEGYTAIRNDVSSGRISAETGNQRIADLTSRFNM